MVEIFKDGGPLMYPILLCSVIGWAIFFERIRTYRKLRKGMLADVQTVRDELQAGAKQGAVAFCQDNPTPLSRIFLRVLSANTRERRQLMDLADEVGSRETMELQRYLGLLATIANIAPLLGLLGTVIGMIEAFHILAAVGSGSPATLGGGISEALITTAAGLSVAVPMILIHRYLSSWAERLTLRMEEYTGQIVDLVSE